MTQQHPGQPQGAGLGQGGGTVTQTAEQPKTFTQDEVNALLGRTREEARQRALAEHADYDQLKQDAAELQKVREASLTEAQKTAKRATEAEQALATMRTRVAETAIGAEVRLQAVRKGIVDPDAALALIDRTGIVYAEDKGVQGVEAALDRLIEVKPYLKPATGPTTPTAPNLNRGGNPAPRVTTLTAEQQQMAERLGVKPEDYAARLRTA